MNVGKFQKSGKRRIRDERTAGLREAVARAYKRRFGEETPSGIWPRKK